MATIAAIETQYAGYRFRSRLEARWAVFLDRAKIGWEYEPEGLDIRIGRGHRMKWLPDFRLETGHWAEVKGQLNGQEALRLLMLASGVGGCPGGADVIVLGRIPRAGSVRWPMQVHKHGSGLWAVPWELFTGCPLEREVPRHRLVGEIPIGFFLEGLMAGVPHWAEEPLARARGARFEHGECG